MSRWYLVAHTFELPDGRKLSINREAVTAVYEAERNLRMDYKDGVWSSVPDGPVSTVIAIGQTNLVVPYTHDEVMALLYSDAE